MSRNRWIRYSHIHDSGAWRQVVIDGGKGAHTYLSLESRVSAQRWSAHKTISRNRSHKVSPNCHKFLSSYAAILLQLSTVSTKTFEPPRVPRSSFVARPFYLRSDRSLQAFKQKLFSPETPVIVGEPSNSGNISEA